MLTSSTKLDAITCQNVEIVTVIPGSDRNIQDINVVEDKICVNRSFFVLTGQMFALKLARISNNDSLMPCI